MAGSLVLPLPKEISARRSESCGKSFNGVYKVSLMTFITSLYVITSGPCESEPATESGILFSVCSIDSR
jgi:hypothetical protein